MDQQGDLGGNALQQIELFRQPRLVFVDLSQTVGCPYCSCSSMLNHFPVPNEDNSEAMSEGRRSGGTSTVFAGAVSILDEFARNKGNFTRGNGFAVLEEGDFKMPVALIEAGRLLDDFADATVAFEAKLTFADRWKLHGRGDISRDQAEELADSVFAALDGVGGDAVEAVQFLWRCVWGEVEWSRAEWRDIY